MMTAVNTITHQNGYMNVGQAYNVHNYVIRSEIIKVLAWCCLISFFFNYATSCL